MIIERFAPSPTGLLHLGHAYSALLAWDNVIANDGKFLLRIEDIDTPRCKPEFERAIYDDLAWLGITWEKPTLRQSERNKAYHETLQKMWDNGHIFACDCTRKDIALAAPQEDGEHLLGPDGMVYPNTCASKTTNLVRHISIPAGYAFRLQTSLAGCIAKNDISCDRFTFEEVGKGPVGQTGVIQFTPKEFETQIGAVVLGRKDIGISYHLACVLDDAYQNVTQVTRGQDLFEATKIHVVLQKILGLPTPTYRHHKLIRDKNGKRLAKRYDAMSIRSYREKGYTPDDIRALVGL